MATITYSSAATSYTTIRPWYAPVTSRAIDEVIWDDGSHVATFEASGSLTYRGTKAIAGIFNAYNMTIDGDAYVSITGMKFSASAMQGFWDRNDYKGFFKVLYAGNDSVTGSDDDDRLSGFGNGKDRDTIDGGAGNDSILGSSGWDSILGGEGDDTISGGGGTDVINAGEGNDTITAGGYSTVTGGTGDDTYILISGTAKIIELGLTDTTPGDDTVTADDTIDGGNDTVISQFSYNLSANIENLVLTGTTAANVLGSADDNTLEGNSGNNKMNGGGGDDLVMGGAGADTISGGLGTDTLQGDAGKDVYLFDSEPSTVVGAENIDTLFDFTETGTQADRIAFGFYTFDNLPDPQSGFKTAGALKADQFYDMSTALPTVLNLDDTINTVATAALQLKIRVMYDPSSGALYYNADGFGTHVDPVHRGPLGVPILIDLPAVQIGIVTVDGTTAAVLNYQDFLIVK